MRHSTLEIQREIMLINYHQLIMNNSTQTNKQLLSNPPMCSHTYPSTYSNQQPPIHIIPHKTPPFPSSHTMWPWHGTIPSFLFLPFLTHSPITYLPFKWSTHHLEHTINHSPTAKSHSPPTRLADLMNPAHTPSQTTTITSSSDSAA